MCLYLAQDIISYNKILIGAINNIILENIYFKIIIYLDF